VNFIITLKGTAPLLMHSSRLANPLDPAAKAMKEFTSKRVKTDDDHHEIARREFIGGMYYDPDAGPYVPADNIHRALLDAAKKTKSGPKIKEGLFISTDINPLAYSGPRNIEKLWEAQVFTLIVSAKVTTQRVMRTRPMFRDWGVAAEGILDEEIIDLKELQKIAVTAGERIGLGDWRPRYGRFTATVEAA
jgi:hypothetical protein